MCPAHILRTEWITSFLGNKKFFFNGKLAFPLLFFSVTWITVAVYNGWKFLFSESSATAVAQGTHGTSDLLLVCL